MTPRETPSNFGAGRMKQAKGPTPAELLSKMPRRPLSVEQQAAAIEKVQQQATQRIKLGQQLFQAADAKLKQHQDILKEIQDQQHILREQVQDDVAKSLQSYDQWMGKIDESFTGAIRRMNERLDQLELKIDASRGELEAMIENAAALIGQTQGLMADAFESASAHEPNTEIDAGDDESDSIDMDLLASEMRQSVPDDPYIDVDSLTTRRELSLDRVPVIRFDQVVVQRSALSYSVMPGQISRYPHEPIESVQDVQIDRSEHVPSARSEDEAQTASALGQMSESGFDLDEPVDAGEDVFGQVLRRLREQAEGDDENAAA